MKAVITGGAGFIGSNLARHLLNKGHEVCVLDNLSRALVEHNLERIKEAEFIKGDVRRKEDLEKLPKPDAIFHCASQVAVTTSLTNPREDFEINAFGTFNVLEFARKHNASVIFCSTNKVYGNGVNDVPIQELETRWDFSGEYQGKGIPPRFPINAHKHSPYGSSKLSGDVYVQDYHAVYGLPTVVNRMSCIYGTHQYGNENQGWVAHFTISAILDKLITIYGDGKQIRDILWVQDLVELFEMEATKIDKFAGKALNIGGGYKNTISLIELLNLLEKISGKPIKTGKGEWREADQKVYYSDISEAEKMGWSPKTSKEEGVSKLYEWLSENRDKFVLK